MAALKGANGAVACDLGDLLVSCDFVDAYAHCDWNGAQGHRGVTRLIGALTADSIVDGVDGSGPAGGGGKGKARAAAASSRTCPRRASESLAGQLTGGASSSPATVY